VTDKQCECEAKEAPAHPHTVIVIPLCWFKHRWEMAKPRKALTGMLTSLLTRTRDKFALPI